MIQQLVMYEEELQQINRICEILHRDSNAKAVLVIDKNGQAIAQAGDVGAARRDVAVFADRRQRRRDRRHRPAPGREASSPVSSTRARRPTSTSRSSGPRVILVVLFDERSSLGLVRLRVRKAAAELTVVLDVLVKKSTLGAGQPSVFSEITDDDIDNLFND